MMRAFGACDGSSNLPGATPFHENPCDRAIRIGPEKRRPSIPLIVMTEEGENDDLELAHMLAVKNRGLEIPGENPVIPNMNRTKLLVPAGLGVPHQRVRLDALLHHA